MVGVEGICCAVPRVADCGDNGFLEEFAVRSIRVAVDVSA